MLFSIAGTVTEEDEGNPENPPFSEDHLGVAFLHLKIVLDAFIAWQK